MWILAIIIGAVVGFFGGFMTAVVCLFDYENDEANYAEFYEKNFYDPEEFK